MVCHFVNYLILSLPVRVKQDGVVYVVEESELVMLTNKTNDKVFRIACNEENEEMPIFLEGLACASNPEYKLEDYMI